MPLKGYKCVNGFPYYLKGDSCVECKAAQNGDPCTHSTGIQTAGVNHHGELQLVLTIETGNGEYTGATLVSKKYLQSLIDLINKETQNG